MSAQHDVIANAEVISLDARRPVPIDGKRNAYTDLDFAYTVAGYMDVLPTVPNLYAKNGALVIVDADCSRPVCDATLLVEMGNVVRVFTKKARGFKEEAPLPRHLAALLKRGSWPGVPVLDTVRRSPCLGHDGAVHSEGFRDGTLVFSDIALSVPTMPTVQDARDSAAALCNLVGEFPFATDSDRSAWLALILTLVARPFIAGSCPMFTVTANAPGSGRTLLFQLASIIALGRETPVQSAPRKDGDEGAKVVFSTLLAGQPYALLDNSKGVLDSKDLEAALTSAEYTGRILGQSRNGTVPTRTV